MSEDASLSSTEEGKTAKRYGILTASLFVLGILGGGVVPMIPQAVVNSGWSGVALILASGVIVACNGYLLGKCWATVQVKYPEYGYQRVADPYPVIAFKASGKIGEYLTRICMDITLFGGATVYTIQIAENINTLIRAFGGGTISICYLILILWCIFTPVSWIGTPKDFWQVGIIAGVSTAVGTVLIVAGLAQDAHLHEDALTKAVTVFSFFNAFGTILFAFGGVSAFPTVQVDMKNPNDFSRAAAMGVTGIMLLYLMVGITGLVCFGGDVTPNVLNTLSANPLSNIIILIVTSQLIVCVVILLNPVTQDIEGLFNIADKFSWKRMLVRTCYTSGITFAALTVPHFSIIVGIVGSSTLAGTSIIFPPLFYLLLSRQLDQDYDEAVDEFQINNVENIGVRRISTCSKTLFLCFIVVGIAGAASSTYFAFDSLVSGGTGFTVPCFVNWSVH